MYDQKGKQQILTKSIPIGLHCFHWFNSTLKLINWEIPSAGSRPWDKGGRGRRGTHPDPETRGCRSPKNLFRPFGPQFRLTISGGARAPRAPPWIRHWPLPMLVNPRNSTLWIPDSRYWIPDPLSEKLGFRIPGFLELYSGFRSPYMRRGRLPSWERSKKCSLLIFTVKK